MVKEIENLYRKYFNDVFLYMRRLCGDEHLAEEITSETFFRAMRSLNKFRNDCDVRVWLCQIAKNCYYTYRKKESRLCSIEEHTTANTLTTTQTLDEQISQHLETQKIQEILHQLPELNKEVFMWRAFADLSFKQIGQIFHKSDNWACVTYHRTVEMIRKRMEDNSNEK